jgi:hypothetical protein
MPEASRSPDPPLLCQRRFEPQRLQRELWLQASEQLVPQRRLRREGAAVVRPGGELVNVSGEVRGFPKRRYA